MMKKYEMGKTPMKPSKKPMSMSKRGKRKSLKRD